MEQEINKAEEAIKCAHGEARQTAKQARDVVQCVKHNCAAVEKAGQDAIWNIPGQVGVLRWPKTFKENNNDDNRLANRTFEERAAYQS
mmetsp:Transcript_4721/g.8577  ORF Transcript_4721/g.8577 Transcript_4721/m.8577 type:complete len:88 (+) Transcript_4721:252-515(+)